MNTKTIQLSDIRLDFQQPENLLEHTVLEYVNKIMHGEEIPPIRVRFDGTNYFCEDGFHRLEASRRVGATTIQAEIFPGTLEQMEAEYREYLKELRKSLSGE